MPKEKPVIFIVGHGTIGNSKTTIDTGNYNLIFPVPINSKFCLTAHNLLLRSLIDASSKSIDELMNEVAKLENLPSTTCVAIANRQSFAIQQAVVQYEELQNLKQAITKFEEDAASSQKGWILFEHKISPAVEILSSSTALTPVKASSDYVEFPLVHDFPFPATLLVCINSTKIKGQITILTEQMNKQEIANDNLIYITPVTIPNTEVKFNLSELLNAIKTTHILAIKTTNTVGLCASDHATSISTASSSSTLDHVTAPVDTIKIVGIALESIVGKIFTAETDKYSAQGVTITNYYDLIIPEDSNIVLGACRDIDSSY